MASHIWANTIKTIKFTLANPFITQSFKAKPDLRNRSTTSYEWLISLIFLSAQFHKLGILSRRNSRIIWGTIEAFLHVGTSVRAKLELLPNEFPPSAVIEIFQIQISS